VKKYAAFGAIFGIFVVAPQYIAVVLDIHASAQLEISWLEEAIYYALGDVEEAIYYALVDVGEEAAAKLGLQPSVAFVTDVYVVVPNVAGAYFLV